VAPSPWDADDPAPLEPSDDGGVTVAPSPWDADAGAGDTDDGGVTVAPSPWDADEPEPPEPSDDGGVTVAPSPWDADAGAGDTDDPGGPWRDPGGVLGTDAELALPPTTR